MVDVTPARIGLLIDYLDGHGGFDENILPSLQLVADEFVAGGIIERPVEFVTRAVQGACRTDPFERCAMHSSSSLRKTYLSSSDPGFLRTVWRCAPMSKTSPRCPSSRWAPPKACWGVGFRPARRFHGGRADHHGDRGSARRLPDHWCGVRRLLDRQRVLANDPCAGSPQMPFRG
jgi:hypothetical protein